MGLGSDLVDLYGAGAVAAGQAGSDLANEFLSKPGSPWTPSQSDSPNGWPDRIEWGSHSVATVKPARWYVPGEALAILWPTGGQPSRGELIKRASTIGEPWWNPGWPGIGVKLSQQATGAQVINTLTASKWAGTIPIELPAEMVAAGLLLAQGSSAVDAAAGAVGDVAGSVGTLAAIGSGLATALPWILVAGGVAVAGYIAYRVIT